MARRAKALAKLLAQLDELVPNRNKSSDGWAASAAHSVQNPTSDHEPDSAGVVRAQDITHDPRAGMDTYKLADVIKKNHDKRLRYQITNRKIMGGNEGPQPWVYRSYNGKNPHDEHIHFSVLKVFEDDESPWDLSGFLVVPNKSAAAKTLPLVSKGSKGFYVSLVQTCLGGSTVDGIFGPMTEQAVLQFQRDHELVADGDVGPYTWRELLRPMAKEVHLLPDDPRGKLEAMAQAAIATGSTASVDALVASFLTIIEDILPPGLKPPSGVVPKPLPPPTDGTLNEQIYDIVAKSAIAKYPWKSRGVAPLAYLNGMALAFSSQLTRLQAGHSAAIEMAKADTHNDEKDALSRYRSNFAAKGMSNATAGPDTLRHLFVLMLGLGMRESSGHHCEGRDLSASNTTADTAEAGLFQMSWDANGASKEIGKLMDEYGDDEGLCFLGAFADGVQCSTSSWANYGTGKGHDFQKLAKECPGFAVASAAVCLRVLCKHFGPIVRKEAEIVPAADVMFAEVQRFVEQEAAKISAAA
jgi:hypothetical protein